MEWLIRIGTTLLIVAVGFILGPVLKKGIIKLSKNASDKGALTFIGSGDYYGVRSPLNTEK